MNDYRLEPLREEHARAILDWRYPPPYDFYDPPEDDNSEYYVTEFLNPELRFHAVLNRDDQFVGFCSYGRDGQVPGGDYSREALDIGLGMKPELTGKGMGEEFFEAILRFAARNLKPAGYRVTVASFNARAISLYRKFGFTADSEFQDARFNVPHTILVRDVGGC